MCNVKKKKRGVGFKACPTPQAKDLEVPFRHVVFKMLKAEGKIVLRC